MRRMKEFVGPFNSQLTRGLQDPIPGPPRLLEEEIRGEAQLCEKQSR